MISAAGQPLLLSRPGDRKAVLLAMLLLMPVEPSTSLTAVPAVAEEAQLQGGPSACSWPGAHRVMAATQVDWAEAGIHCVHKHPVLPAACICLYAKHPECCSIRSPRRRWGTRRGQAGCGGWNSRAGCAAGVEHRKLMMIRSMSAPM